MLTATLSAQGSRDICELFEIQPGKCIRTGCPLQVCPSVQVLCVDRPMDSVVQAIERHGNESSSSRVLVYCRTVADTESLASKIGSYAKAHHSQLSREEKESLMQWWHEPGVAIDDGGGAGHVQAEPKSRCLVTTSGFGLGINPGRVDLIICACVPLNVEECL